MKRILTTLGLSLTATLFLFGCGQNPINIDATMLDSPGVSDTSLSDPTLRISSNPRSAMLDRNRPVVICVHGFASSTWEWLDFHDYADADGRAYTSLVLLGGHGLDYEDLRTSTWQEWQAPIMAEYDSLVSMGFKHISMAGSSTGGTLLLDYLSRKAFDTKAVLPEHFFLIDPIVVSTDKNLSLVGAVGPLIGSVHIDDANTELRRNVYLNRPYESLVQLNDLLSVVRQELEKGITLPGGATAWVHKVTTDDAADPVSALFIYKGTHTADGGTVGVTMVESDLHVFTNLRGRSRGITAADSLNQRKTFEDILGEVAQRP